MMSDGYDSTKETRGDRLARFTQAVEFGSEEFTGDTITRETLTSPRALLAELIEFRFVAPHAFLLESIAFGTDCAISNVFVGQQNIFYLWGDVPVSDFPDRKINCSEIVEAVFTVSIKARKLGVDPCEFSARLLGKREPPRKREVSTRTRALKRGTLGAVTVGGETDQYVLPGHAFAFTVRLQVDLRVDRIVVDDPTGLILDAVEIARDPQIDAPIRLARDTPLPLPVARSAEEIRLVVRNTGERRVLFKARLHGEVDW